MYASDLIQDPQIGVDPKTVQVLPMPWWLRLVLSDRTLAVTLPWAIYVRDGWHHDAYLIFHELVHARQWRNLGISGFSYRYLRDYLAGRLRGEGHWLAYMNISLEKAAREEARSVIVPLAG